MTYDSDSNLSEDSGESLTTSKNRLNSIRREIKMYELHDNITSFLIEKGKTMTFDYFKYVNTYKVINTVSRINKWTNSRYITLNESEQYMYFELINFIRKYIEKPINITPENIQYVHNHIYDTTCDYYVSSSNRYYIDPMVVEPYDINNYGNLEEEDIEEAKDV
jgi:hypothetical protein